MIKKSNKRTILSFILSLFVCSLFVIPVVDNRISEDIIRIDHLLTDKSAKISEAISIPVNQLYTVASYIQRKQGDLTNIEDLAATVASNEYIRNLIIAPNYVVEKVYPTTPDNLEVIGLDYYKDTTEGNKEAILAAEKRELMLAGPFTTVVGDKAISGRYPVILNDEHGEHYVWGIIAITLKYPEIMNTTNLESLSAQGYTYELWHNNVDTGKREVIMSNGIIEDDSNYLDREVQVLNAQWYLRISSMPRWYHYPDPWYYILFSIGISFLLAWMVKQNYNLRETRKELERMVDHDILTKTLNRQGLFRRFNKIMDNSQDFIVSYLDLNDFKGFNDEYGHSVGDTVLIEFANRIEKHMDKGQLFARVGGDKFIIVQKQELSWKEQMEAFWKKIDFEFERPIITVNDVDVYLSFSRGSAIYQLGVDELDDVISKADYRMYLMKKEL